MTEARNAPPQSFVMPKTHLTASIKACMMQPPLNMSGAEFDALGITSHSEHGSPSDINNQVQGNNNIDPSNANPPLMQQNPDTNMGGFLNDGGGTDSLLELAVNTNQYGRTFQDRTHVMEIQAFTILTRTLYP